jgi:hypothetical protein
MTVREWFRDLRRQQPPTLELAEFLRTYGRIDSEFLGLERDILWRVALESMRCLEPEHPNALTLHRMGLGSCIIGGSLRYGDPQKLEPRVVLSLAEPTYSWPPRQVVRWQVDEVTYESLALEAETARRLREGDWTTGASGDPTMRE